MALAPTGSVRGNLFRWVETSCALPARRDPVSTFA